MKMKGPGVKMGNGIPPAGDAPGAASRPASTTAARPAPPAISPVPAATAAPATIDATAAVARPSPEVRLATGAHWLWPTPIGVHRYPNAATFNSRLAQSLQELRGSQERKRGQPRGAFFASDDDLLQRVKLGEWPDFVRFVISSVLQTVREVNHAAWAGQTFDLGVGIEGMWFQCSRDGAFHDIHTHGNCSWSAVYIVQIDERPARVAHPVYGEANGVTRLYGPPFTALAGAFVDVANAYLQPPHQDIEPVPGQLVLFPSWLAHKAMPYVGEQDRIIISFNASVHASQGDQIHSYSPN